jgi:hypothetical protein
MARTRRYFAIILISALLALLGLGAALAQETPADGQTPSGGTTGTEQPTQTQQTPIMVYFFKDGELVGVAREIPGGGQMVEFTVNDLLKGPSEEEQAEGYTSYLPEGLKLLYSTKSMSGNAFSVNLSSELMSLKDTPEQAQMAMQQLVQTLKEAAHTEEIKVTVDVDEANRGVDAFEALGVSSKDAGVGSSSNSGEESSLLWLWILIILAVTLVILAFLIPLYLNNRKAEATLEQEIEEDKAKRDAKKK